MEARFWVETVTEGGQRFMAAWRKEEVDANRHLQYYNINIIKREERGSGTRKVSGDRTRKRRTCEATAAGLVDEPKEPCTGARPTET